MILIRVEEKEEGRGEKIYLQCVGCFSRSFVMSVWRYCHITPAIRVVIDDSMSRYIFGSGRLLVFVRQI